MRAEEAMLVNLYLLKKDTFLIYYISLKQKKKRKQQTNGLEQWITVTVVFN